MEHERHLAAIERDAAGLLAAARAADPATRIDACPDWTPADLVWHMGSTHRFWATIAGQRLQAPPADWPPDRPADDDVYVWAEESATLLVDALTGADPTASMWSWSPRQDVGFAFRRMAHETAVHRADAELAAGRPYEVEAELAADGIDEFFDLFLRYAEGDAPPLGGSVHVHCTDADGEWTINPGTGDALVVTRDHAKADTALRGPASDLLLALWRRLPVEATRIDVFGDTELAARFLARTNND